MKIPVQKAVDSVVAFLSSESMKVTRVQDRFLMLVSVGAVSARPHALIAYLTPRARAVGIMDDDGMVDTDVLRPAMDLAFSSTPALTIDGIPLSFTRDDAVEVLRRMEA